VHQACRRADLGVGIGAEILANKIDQPRVTLQQREQLQRGVGARLLQHRRSGRRCSRWRSRRRYSSAIVERGKARSQICIRQQAEQGAECQWNAAQQGELDAVGRWGLLGVH